MPAEPLSLVVLDGPTRGAAHWLTHGRNRIGRDPACEVAIPDERVSRLHAEVVFENGAWSLCDPGSRNGTWLNGVRCEQAPLAVGDELRLGGVGLLVVAGTDEPGLAGSSAGRTTVGMDRPVRTRGRGSAPAASVPGLPSRSPMVLIGDSPPMMDVHRTILRVAPTDLPVLVVGESGTGKELVAEAIHRNSRHRSGPFVALNGAVLGGEILESELFGHEQGAFTGAVARRKGAFELACGGTLFLDEVAELPPETQAALLRVIEGKGFRRLGGAETLAPEVRLIAATHRDLAAWVREGRFREDLYYRLARVRVDLPPLRARGADVRILAGYFLEALREKTGTPARRFSEGALRALESYAFPGNVRELRNLVERIAIYCDHDEVGPDDLPSEVRPSAPACDRTCDARAGRSFPTLRELEREHVLRALEAAGGNKTQAARLLGVDRATLYARIERYGREDPAP